MGYPIVVNNSISVDDQVCAGAGMVKHWRGDKEI